MTLSLRAQDTVRSIVDELERRGLAYAIARNYEMYPNFGHDLDIFYDGATASFESLAVEVGSKHRWDAVVYCGHWNTSPVSQHNIDVFRFYKRDQADVLDVDLFRGFLVWSVPLLTSGEIIRAGQRHPTLGFRRPDMHTETLFRLLQINSIASNPAEAEKVRRYRSRALDCIARGDEEFISASRRLGFRLRRHTVDCLRNEDYRSFHKHMRSAKFRYVLRHFARQPLATLLSVWARLRDYYYHFCAEPCGFVLEVLARTAAEREVMRRAMDRLVMAHAITRWSEREGGGAWLTLRDRMMLERRGILIHWAVAYVDDAFIVGEEANEYSVMAAVLDRIIARHRPVFASKIPCALGNTDSSTISAALSPR